MIIIISCGNRLGHIDRCAASGHSQTIQMRSVTFSAAACAALQICTSKYTKGLHMRLSPCFVRLMCRYVRHAYFTHFMSGSMCIVRVMVDRPDRSCFFLFSPSPMDGHNGIGNSIDNDNRRR